MKTTEQSSCNLGLEWIEEAWKLKMRQRGAKPQGQHQGTRLQHGDQVAQNGLRAPPGHLNRQLARQRGHDGFSSVSAWIENTVNAGVFWVKFHFAEANLKPKMSQFIYQTVAEWVMSWGLTSLMCMPSLDTTSTAGKQCHLCTFPDVSTSEKS